MPVAPCLIVTGSQCISWSRAPTASLRLIVNGPHRTSRSQVSTGQPSIDVIGPNIYPGCGHLPINQESISLVPMYIPVAGIHNSTTHQGHNFLDSCYQKHSESAPQRPITPSPNHPINSSPTSYTPMLRPALKLTLTLSLGLMLMLVFLSSFTDDNIQQHTVFPHEFPFHHASTLPVPSVHPSLTHQPLHCVSSLSVPSAHPGRGHSLVNQALTSLVPIANTGCRYLQFNQALTSLIPIANPGRSIYSSTKH